jgi:hypothetical protein
MKISIDRVESIEIQNEYRNANCRNAEFLGSFSHPDYPNNTDWKICLYIVCDTLVFSTNGNPIWQNDCEAFDSLVETYGISIEDALADLAK